MSDHQVTSNINSIMSWASRLPGRVGNAIRQTLHKHSEEMAEQARKNAQAGRPFLYKRKGVLLRGIKPMFKVSGTKTELGITFPKIPGQALNDGAVIVPRRGKYLVYRLFANTTEATPSGPWRKSRRVVIPGTKWATKAVEQAGKKLPALLQKQVIGAFRGTP